MSHVPVLQKEVIKYLDPKPDENFIDCTIGSGGHTLAILERTAPTGKVLGIDWDTEAIAKLKTQTAKLWKRLILVNDNFAHIQDIVQREKFRPVHGILLDLGMSSDQLEKSGRGFTFQKNEPLDMRYDPANLLDATKILNFWSRQDIERIFKEYGEEQFAQEIAKAIVAARSEKPIIKTFQLVDIITHATPKWYQRKKLHPATKTFQALRITVNNELQNLTHALPQAVSVLSPGGRIAAISFHSLEDRIVKRFFRSEPSLKVLTKKPATASWPERKTNPKSRSAKLRVCAKET
ncbi:MAG: 16S rRNA (cytosine(1402)-N(4))-methyltransferase RsmH [Candidatus Wildermuthbacteria bacterium]|nr:16S rRNA (cytosine(1402)-N(4))-methyltransferase RsmH [Candidatus Wildermuthbacteria bacterium]